MPTNLEILTQLPRPARYLPWMHQRDLLSPGLFRLGHDFGNGSADQYYFQFDSLFPSYYSNMLENQREQHRYYCRDNFSAVTKKAINHFIVEKLLQEHTALFEKNNEQLHCQLTGNSISLDNDDIDLFDQLASQVQEDIAVLQFDKQGNNSLCALHLNCPNHWGANQRIGKSFLTLHEAVPGFNESLRDSDKLLQGIMKNGPYVRFVWGLCTDTQLNLHPEKIAARQLNTVGKLFARVERQLLHGLPGTNALLFLIRTSFIDIDGLRQNESANLLTSLKDMSPSMLEYKGLTNIVNDVVLKLQSTCNNS